MRLYLVRHGDALQEKMDAECPLSERGKNDITKIAWFIKHQPLQLGHIYHSGILRAQQTAEILAKNLHFPNEIEIYQEMQPYDAVAPVAIYLNQETENILMVGHMPFLGLLVSKLVTGDEHQDILYFHKGTIACLERIAESSTWLIDWCIVPPLVMPLAETV